MLQSLDLEGKRKITGGDEFYVTFRDKNNNSFSPTAIARVRDLDNGSYKLNFVKSCSPEGNDSEEQAGIGSITISLLYTCFVGAIKPPLKNEWNHSFLTNNEYTSMENVKAPPMTTANLPKIFPELALYETVYVLGASTMRQ